MAELTFWEDTSADVNWGSYKTWTIGNIVVASMAPEVTFLDHYTTVNGTRKKDRSLITNKALAVNFTFDEMTGGAMKEWLLASSMLGESMTAQNFEIYPMAKGEIKGCAKLEFNSEFGRDYSWYIPCASLKPDGTMDYNAEDWMNAKGIIECLVDEAGDENRPFGKIVFDDSNIYENYS
jgi:hypothetical protein